MGDDKDTTEEAPAVAGTLIDNTGAEAEEAEEGEDDGRLRSRKADEDEEDDGA